METFLEVLIILKFLIHCHLEYGPHPNFYIKFMTSYLPLAWLFCILISSVYGTEYKEYTLTAEIEKNVIQFFW